MTDNSLEICDNCAYFTYNPDHRFLCSLNGKKVWAAGQYFYENFADCKNNGIRAWCDAFVHRRDMWEIAELKIFEWCGIYKLFLKNIAHICEIYCHNAQEERFEKATALRNAVRRFENMAATTLGIKIPYPIVVSVLCPNCGGVAVWKPANKYIAPTCLNCGHIGRIHFNDMYGPYDARGGSL